MAKKQKTLDVACRRKASEASEYRCDDAAIRRWTVDDATMQRYDDERCDDATMRRCDDATMRRCSDTTMRRCDDTTMDDATMR